MSGWASHLVLGSTGLALTVLATALVLRAWRKLPVASYRLGVAVLSAALALPAAQLAARALGLPFGHPVRTVVQALRAGPRPEPAPATPPPSLPLASTGLPGMERLVPAAPTLRIDPALLALALLGQETGDPETPRAPAADVAAAAPTGTRRVPWKALVAGAYLAGVLLALGRTARRLLRTRSLLRSASPVRDGRVRATWREVSRGSPLARRVRLLSTDEVRAPACFGLGRPTVVLPADESLIRRRDVLACVLTHELVHLERRDGWVLLGEELLRAVFWFHPAAWWLVAQLERLREVSCDLLVVRRTGQRRRYAQALVEYAAWMTAGERVLGGRAGQAAAVVPWSGSNGQLTRRIEMLLSNQAPKGGRARYLAPATVALVFSFLWSGQIALAAGTQQETVEMGHDQCVHGKQHCAECGHHGSSTKIEATGGVIVTTQDKSGKAVLKAEQLELKPGQKVLIARDGDRIEQVDALVQKGDAPIGIVVGEADETLAAHLGEDKQRVVVVRSVVPGSRAAKAGLQEHDVIVSVNGKSGNKQDLIDYAKQALREGRDVKVVVVRKGDRKPLVLRSGDGQAAAVWVESGGEKGGEAQVLDLSHPAGKELRLKVEADEQGHYRVFGLGGDGGGHGEEHEVQVWVDEWNEAIGEGGGGGGGKVQTRVWTSEDGTITTFGHIQDGGAPHAHGKVAEQAGEHEVKTFVFGLGQDGEMHELHDVTVHGGGSGGKVHVDGDGGVEVFGVDGQGRVVTRKQSVKKAPDGKQVIELQVEVEGNEGGEHVIELQLEGDELGKALRKQAQEYYRQVDPEEFHMEIQKALEVYESRRKDFVDQQELQQMKKLQVYARKDAQEALEQARKALEGLSDEELSARTKKALKESRLLLGKDAYQLHSEGKAYELRERDSAAVPQAKIEALKEELNATRKQLAVQRKQIEELKRALEKLARERELR